MGKRKREEESEEESEDEVMEEVEKKKKKKHKKAKKAKIEEPVEEENEDSDDEGEEKKKSVKVVSVIADPLANRKLSKKCYKLVKKASKEKKIRRGVKEVVKALRKNEKGLCIIAGDVSPIDVISHIPVFCEDKEVPYVFVNSRQKLGEAGLTKRPTSIIMVTDKTSEEELLKKCISDVKKLVPNYITGN